MTAAVLRFPPASAVAPLAAVLRQLAGLVEGMSDEQYRTKPAGLSSNVGGHVRHCLDHVDALLAAVESGELDYDRRQRGTDVETNRAAALAVVRRQTRRLLALRDDARLLRMTAIVCPDLPQVTMTTSVGRELAFVLSHTVHHNALVGVIAAAVGAVVPERFGYAPSTLAHREGGR